MPDLPTIRGPILVNHDCQAGKVLAVYDPIERRWIDLPVPAESCDHCYAPLNGSTLHHWDLALCADCHQAIKAVSEARQALTQRLAERHAQVSSHCSR